MKLKYLAAMLAAGTGILMGPAGVASATVLGPELPNPSYGFDGNAHLIVGGGSTAVYKIAQGFADVWDSSQSCFTNNATADPAATPQSYPQTGAGAFNQCTPAGTQQVFNGTNAGGNFDGDTVAIAAPQGSGTGIGSLNGYDGGPGIFAYEGVNENLTTVHDHNALSLPTYGSSRSDTVTLTTGLSTFTDASAVATDVGEPVTSTASGFPANATVISVSSGTVTVSGAFTGTTGTYSVTFPNALSGQPPGNQLSNGFGTVDFALSSRAAKTTKGECALSGNGGANDELACDTVWGVAADGLQVFTWDSSVGDLNAAGGLTATDLYNIWECNYTEWGQLPEYSTLVADGAANLPPSNAPIVPWSMSTQSGNYADFNSYVSANDGGLSFTADDKKGTYGPLTSNNPTPTTAGDCARDLSSSALPLANDIKPLIEDVELNYNGGSGPNTTNPLSTNNPNNWIWFGSNGLPSPTRSCPSPTSSASSSPPGMWTSPASSRPRSPSAGTPAVRYTQRTRSRLL